MFAPNVTTHQLADTIHAERQAHAALLHKAKADRQPTSLGMDRQAQRRITVRRLSATLAGAVLTFAIAAAVAANQPAAAPAAGPASGGGVTLLR
jgi:hypothetical protein